jgi:membrane protein required for beta-lactamase induction
MTKVTLLQKVGIGLCSLFLIAALGAGCATQEQVDEAVKKAQDAAVRAEAAAAKAEAAAAKCEQSFEKGLRK